MLYGESVTKLQCNTQTAFRMLAFCFIITYPALKYEMEGFSPPLIFLLFSAKFMNAAFRQDLRWKPFHYDHDAR